VAAEDLPAAPVPSGPPTLDDVVGVLWAAADVQRARILRLLAQDSFSVSELSELLRMPQPALSHHLKLLGQGGWVAMRKEGASAYYRRAVVSADDPHAALRQHTFAALDGCALESRLVPAVAALHERRRASSEAFFTRHAAAFRQHQDQIVEPGVYVEPLLQLLDASGPREHRLGIELGPGTGDLLTRLAGRFRRLIGIDASAAMLAQARARVRSIGLKNVRLVLGDTEALAEQTDADALFCCMVLHHLPSPAALFPAARAALAPRGRLFLVELCPHQQDWARECCGDLWLGFEQEDLLAWARAAGFGLQQSQYLSQRNGFAIQLHVFQVQGLQVQQTPTPISQAPAPRSPLPPPQDSQEQRSS
jgi:ArsR family transcriptional regulator